jgi:RHS repeat-associated protein
MKVRLLSLSKVPVRDVKQKDHYYPFGLNISALSSTAPLSKPNRFKLSGNEEQTEFDLNVYDFNARTYDPALGRFMNIDPMADQFYNLTPYNYVENNPLRFIDPDGMLSTEVEENEDGTYKVVGGDADDGDNGIYVRNEDGGRGELVGYSATPESFYYSEKDEWKGTIDPNDQSGRNFLNKDILQDNPSLLKYAPNATKNGKYDFKSTNGTDEVVYDDPEDFYRGMPILDKKNGKPIFASARDIGNISGGIIAGRGGRGWAPSRLAFDALESYQKGGFTSESTSTQYGEKLGHRIGSQIYLKETASRFPGNGHLRSIKISKDVIKKGDL